MTGNSPPALRVEIIPTHGIVEAVASQLRSGTTLTVTCLPHHGVERTMETASALADRGYNAVPHLAARSISSRQQLVGILKQCSAAGITEVFTIGGDKGRPDGPYASSGALMQEIEDISGHSLRMGVGGYPEGHPAMGTQQLADSLMAKHQLADYLVTQMCFSAGTIESYIAGLRQVGIELPVWAGVAGAIPRTKLVGLATKIGVGSSLRFLSGQGSLGRRLLGGSKYSPEPLMEQLAAVETPLAGIHLYSFNNFAGIAEGPL
ncbi:methylenetetrahydrofolate reductase [Arthrobacter antibioticus]|uniref:methylenetetrahydrofolate reductase n=1 Tax=Arthrobacter sp. H35-MC1 TaxID=3046203 RepID=UPI0024BBA783|nr:methylenetetrahydrofolate reductase [Arthrobacter sp. H35-MC1]MDJ0317553.1 methylenetetrahydrofolate reductase [Arthrobacter sp. H35-MC1]